MQKVDRLGWTAGFAFTAYGASVGIRTNDPAVLDRIPDLLPPEWELTSNPVVNTLFSLRVAQPSLRKGRRNYNLLYGGATRLARSFDLEEVLHILESYLHITVAFWAKEDHLFVHAGVVGWQGKAIVMPGRSYVGKTTLVSELIRAGATYYSDDMAVLDPEGRVRPYPVPLAVREEAGTCKYAPDRFGSAVGEEPLPVGLVLMTQYGRDERWRPRLLSPSRAMMALLDNTVAARKDPKVALPILYQVVTTAPTIKTRRGEASEVAEKVLAAMPT